MEVNSKPLQVRSRWCKLGSLFALVVLVQETSVGSGTGGNWVARPVGARWKCSFSRSQRWDPSPVGLLLSKLDPMVVVRKLKRSFLEAFLGQARPPLQPQLAESVGVATSMVRCDAPTNLHGITSRPSCGHNVPERKVLGPGSVPIPASRAIASLPRLCICRATTRVSTRNATTRMHWRSSRCPPRVVAEEVKLFWNLVAEWFLLSAASSHPLPVEVVCLLTAAVLLVKFWQPCFVVKLLAVSPKLRVKSWSTWNLCEVGEPKTG